MDLVTEVKDTDSDEWTRVSVTITIASQTEVTTAFFLDNMQGWAYFSCFQLEKSAAANKFNMLRNAFFEEAFNATGENGWKLSQGESADQIVTDSVKGKCARLRGNLSKNKNLMQTVKVSGKEGDVFVFGCSVKADAIPGRIFRVRAVVHFTDKTTTETIVNCNPYVTEWQFVNGVILTRKDGSTTNKTYESIQIYLEYQKQQNDAFFTGLQLIRDDAESYVYDANGNYEVQTLADVAPQIFDWLALLNMNVWVILILIVTVAGFNMVSGLLILILDKTSLIGILKALGYKNVSLRKLFLYISAGLIIKGMLWGNVLAFVLAGIQAMFRVIHLDPVTYYMDTVPINFGLGYVVLLNVGVIVVTVLMLIVPTMLISKISPVKAIKFE